jgi:hypothetical protein
MWQYGWLTLKHKYFVFRAGLKTGAPLWRLLIHDWTKFTWSQYPHYQRQFFGDKSDQDGFNRAWLHHQNRSPHHWEYWMLRTSHDRGTPKLADNAVLPMPMKIVREMVADWLGASRAYAHDDKWPNINDWPWYRSSYPKKVMHELTRQRVQQVLTELKEKGHFIK